MLEGPSLRRILGSENSRYKGLELGIRLAYLKEQKRKNWCSRSVVSKKGMMQDEVGDVVKVWWARIKRYLVPRGSLGCFGGLSNRPFSFFASC